MVSAETLYGPYAFLPFPLEATELKHSFQQLLHEIREAVGAEDWNAKIILPPNVRKLLAEEYKSS